MTVSKFGLWWEYSCNDGKFKIFGGGDGFSRDETEELGAQVLKESQKSEGSGVGRYSLVRLSGSELYVHIGATGNVTLPRLNNGKFGRTSDSSDIPGLGRSLGDVVF